MCDVYNNSEFLEAKAEYEARAFMCALSMSMIVDRELVLEIVDVERKTEEVRNRLNLFIGG